MGAARIGPPAVGPGTGALVRFAASPVGSGADASACAVTLNQQAITNWAVGTTIQGGATQTYNGPNGIHMGASPADNCQGASFDISLALTAGRGGFGRCLGAGDERPSQMVFRPTWISRSRSDIG